jgi:hypothetical protein
MSGPGAGGRRGLTGGSGVAPQHPPPGEADESHRNDDEDARLNPWAQKRLSG